jgi:hypothetical protein
MPTPPSPASGSIPAGFDLEDLKLFPGVTGSDIAVNIRKIELIQKELARIERAMIQAQGNREAVAALNERRKSMLKTIGYQQFRTNRDLMERLKAEGITHLVDVRSKPWSRKKGFGKKDLMEAARAAGIAYTWRGDTLGGLAAITENAIKQLFEFQKTRAACIMCMEADPDKCHRNYEIGARIRRYGVIPNHLT